MSGWFDAAQQAQETRDACVLHTSHGDLCDTINQINSLTCVVHLASGISVSFDAIESIELLPPAKPYWGIKPRDGSSWTSLVHVRYSDTEERHFVEVRAMDMFDPAQAIEMAQAIAAAAKWVDEYGAQPVPAAARAAA